jgi:hypothetical protein
MDKTKFLAVLKNYAKEMMYDVHAHGEANPDGGIYQVLGYYGTAEKAPKDIQKKYNKMADELTDALFYMLKELNEEYGDIEKYLKD